MNLSKTFLSLCLATIPLVACSGEPSKAARDASFEPDTSTGDAGIRDTSDGSDGSDAGQTDAGQTDAGQTDTGQTDAGQTDAGQTDAGQTPGDLPFRGEIVLDGASRREAELTLPVPAAGVLVVELYDAAVDLDDITLQTCTGESSNSCIGTNFRAPPRDYVPYRAITNVEQGDIRLEFSISSFTEPQGPQAVQVGIEFLEFETIDMPPDAYAEARTLDLPGAYRVSITGGTPAWFEVEMDRPGYLSILRSNNDTYLCDMSVWTPNPEGCRYDTRETERDITVPGTTYLIAESTFDRTREFIVFGDEDPTASVCPVGQHPAGDGTCAPVGACASGYHDGGWGSCVPDGTCSTNFVLRPDGRCQGWVAAGQLETFDGVNDEVLAGPNGTVIVTGERVDGSGNRVYAPQVWTPATRTWSTADPALSPVGVRRTCPLADGRLLTMRYGGFVTTAPADSEQIFDPAAGTWAAPLTTPGISWTRPTCLLLADGRTLVFESGRAQLFDPTTELWTAAGAGPSGHDHVGVEASAGRVYSAANDAIAAVSRHLWHWNSTTDAWTTTPDWGFIDELDDDVLVVAAGGDPIVILRDGRMARFDTSMTQWETLAPIITPGVQATFIFGADAQGDEIFFTYQGRGVGLYDLASQVWEALPQPTFSGLPLRSLGDYLLVGEHPQRLRVGN